MQEREFRHCWLLALGKPALITLLLSVPFIAWALVDFPHSTRVALFALVPLAWLYSRYLVWRTTRWTFDAQAKALVIRSGVVNRNERRIPLSFPPQVNYSQSWVGRLFNSGTAELSSFGGPVTFRQVGDLRAFKEALASLGQAVSEKRSPFLGLVVVAFFVGLFKLMQGVVIGLVWLVRTSTPLLARFLKWLSGQTRSGISVVAAELTQLARATEPLFARLLDWLQKQVRPAVHMAVRGTKGTPSVRSSRISAFHANYAGFLAFCVDFVLPFNGHRTLPENYTQPSEKRTYYPTGISVEVAQIYLWVLCQVRIVVSGINGRSGWVLRQQIQTINDIELRVSREAFEEIISWHSVLSRIEELTVPQMQSEHTLRVVKRNNNGHSSKQILAFPESRRRDGQRPVA